MVLKITSAALFVLCWSASGSAQAPASPSAEAAAPAASPVSGKREACKQSVFGKKLRGPERADAMQICIAEARLDCVKEAVAKKVPMVERKEFVKGCVGTKPDQRDGDKQDN